MVFTDRVCASLLLLAWDGLLAMSNTFLWVKNKSKHSQYETESRKGQKSELLCVLNEQIKSPVNSDTHFSKCIQLSQRRVQSSTDSNDKCAQLLYLMEQEKPRKKTTFTPQ